MGSEGRQVSGDGPDEVAGSSTERPSFDTSAAHIARVYDYWLGGKDNFAADRAAAEQAIAAYPDIVLPVALMLMAILQHLDNADDPYAIVATLLDALPAGSYLALSHPASDIEAEAQGELARRLNQTMAEKVTMRAA